MGRAASVIPWDGVPAEVVEGVSKLQGATRRPSVYAIEFGHLDIPDLATQESFIAELGWGLPDGIEMYRGPAGEGPLFPVYAPSGGMSASSIFYLVAR